MTDPFAFARIEQNARILIIPVDMVGLVQHALNQTANMRDTIDAYFRRIDRSEPQPGRAQDTAALRALAKELGDG